MKQSMMILYVADQARSTLFYECVLGRKPVLNVPGMTEFIIDNQIKLGLMPESGIAKIICPVVQQPASGNGIPRCELYLIVESPDFSLAQALKAGAIEISQPLPRDWGDTVAYCMDPDGHVLAFAK